MAVLAQKILVGTIGRVYELRTIGTKSTSVIDFSVAVTPRKKDGDNWVDGETNWQNVTAWNRLAENVAASLKPGDRVIVWGREDMKPGYTNKDGVDVGPRPIVVADFVGLEISFAPAKSERKPANGGNSSAPTTRKAAAAPAPTVTVEEDIFSDDDEFDFENDGPPF
jgi:single-strand DNA-binding protein